MLRICLLPGLGFDRRIFAHLQLPGYHLHFLDWLEPQGQEPLAEYATRMVAELPHAQTGTWCLIGHSFGGILAQEMAKSLPVRQIILISSIQSPDENPWFFRHLSATGLYRLVHQQTIRWSFPLWARRHGFDTSASRALFRSMVQQYSNHYLRWAMRQLADWQGVEGQVPITRIHGELDKTFPYSFLRGADYLLRDGDHFMVWKQADIVNQWILETLKEYDS